MSGEVELITGAKGEWGRQLFSQFRGEVYGSISQTIFQLTPLDNAIVSEIGLSGYYRFKPNLDVMIGIAQRVRQSDNTAADQNYQENLIRFGIQYERKNQSR